MSTWDLSTGDVVRVLETVAGHIGDEDGTEGLSLHARSLETAVNDANDAAASAPIGTALQEFSGHCLGLVGYMIGRGSSGVAGAGNATRHYINGNLEMAAEAQANAGSVED
ncbi:DUF6507 family protein [Streptomonospora nanhaiensis]|uniref:DUF6507 family protein n=1 Tax=Streptomonospora nanhaiensis TaxID=1323731 RepID=UPI001C38DFCC|nr:DUF6507 family protein [Streptomonospora nanhaiensis]MBV2362283.1 hypothetical protein [Streptomonospora nanhaiensis]